MLNLISCELLKLKRSKMVLISVAGVLSTPLLMLIEALQTHFDKPEIIFTLSDIYSDSVLYIMLLVNIMIYVAIAAYLFSREYTESTPQNHIAHTHFKDKTINWKILHPASLDCYANPCNMGRYIYRLWAI